MERGVYTFIAQKLIVLCFCLSKLHYEYLSISNETSFLKVIFYCVDITIYLINLLLEFMLFSAIVTF